MRRGFTLLEMLVVIGIIAVLSAAALAGYSRVLKAGEHARAHELVVNVATALTAYFNREGVWPKVIRTIGESGGKLDEKVAWHLRNDFSVNAPTDDTQKQTIGYDRFGIVTPWAAAVIKRRGTAATLTTHVIGTSKIEDHILHFAVDLDGDGLIENVSIGGQGKGSKTDTISVRATAIVWCCDQEGKIKSYSEGVSRDGIYSWSYGQTRSVK